MIPLLRPVGAGEQTPFWKRVDPWVASEYGVVLLISAFFLMFKTFGMWLQRGDEHIYFAMAQSVAAGKIPYRDFFFSHPPVHLLVPALLFKLLGFSYALALSIAPMASLGAGLAIWRFVRRFAPPWAAVLAMVLLLFNRTILQSSTHLTGVNIGLMFLLWGVERLGADRPRTAGALFGLAAMTGLYFLPAAVGSMLLFALFRPRQALRAGILFVGVAVGIVALFDLVSRGAFFDQVVWYHRAKSPEMGLTWPSFDSTKGAELFYNWRLVLGTILGGLACLTALAAAGAGASAGNAPPRRRKRRASAEPAAPIVSDPWGAVGAAFRVRNLEPIDPDAAARAQSGFAGWMDGVLRGGILRACRAAPWAAVGVAAALWVTFHWMFLQSLPVVWRYYYVVFFAGTAVATAAGAVAVWRSLRPLAGLVRGAHRRTWVAPAAFGALLLALYVGAYSHDLVIAREAGLWGEAEDDDSERVAQCSPDACRLRQTSRGCSDGVCGADGGCDCVYGWSGSPAGWVPAAFERALRAAAWGGERIPDGRRYGWIENTLWHESRGSYAETRFREAALAIVEQACPGDTIFGDSGSAPLLANLTGLRIAGDVYDTNQQRFATGFIDPEDVLIRIRADRVRFVVLGGNSWAKKPPLAAFFEEFEPLWPGPGEPGFSVRVLIHRDPSPCR